MSTYNYNFRSVPCPKNARFTEPRNMRQRTDAVDLSSARSVFPRVFRSLVAVHAISNHLSHDPRPSDTIEKACISQVDGRFRNVRLSRHIGRTKQKWNEEKERVFASHFQ